MGLLVQQLNTAALLLPENVSSCQEGGFPVALRASVSEHITNAADPLKIPLRYTSQFIIIIFLYSC